MFFFFIMTLLQIFTKERHIIKYITNMELPVPTQIEYYNLCWKYSQLEGRELYHTFRHYFYQSKSTPWVIWFSDSAIFRLLCLFQCIVKPHCTTYYLKCEPFLLYPVNLRSTYINMIIWQSRHIIYADYYINKVKDVMGMKYFWGNSFGSTDHFHFVIGTVTLFD